MLLKNCRFIVTQNKSREILEHTDVLIENGIIRKIGKTLTGSPKIDCKNKIVLPGLINCHTHIGMQSLRGICDDKELSDWLSLVISAEKKLTEKKIYENAIQACREMLASGTTSFCDMYYPVKPILRAVEKMHMHALLSPTIFAAIGTEKKQFKETILLMKKYQSNHLITIGFGPHSIYGATEKSLELIRRESDILQARKNIHIAETRKERVECFEKHKLLPVQYLEKIGFLDNKTILAHAVWLTKGELSLIAKAEAMVVHCPTSNMKLAGGGVMPLREMQNLGIVVGLGTDSVASNNSLDMFSEMKMCGLLQKHHYWDPTMAPVQMILDMATINGAKILGKEKEIGSLEVGKKADIVVLEIGEHLMPLTVRNVVSAIVYSAKGSDVRCTIVEGKVVYGEGE